MSIDSAAPGPELTAYEARQIRRIAAWKSEPTEPLSELWRRTTLPVANLVEKLIPDMVVREVICGSYDISRRFSSPESVARRAGVGDVSELGRRSLEECDRLAIAIGTSAEATAALEGAATGAGGILTTFLDVPILFVLSLVTIRKIGQCYGYPLDHLKERQFVLGVLIAGLSRSVETRRRRVHRLREIEELLIEDLQEDILTEEALSLLFQLEIFEEIPGVGAISGGLLNWLYMSRIERTARKVFQERRLRDNGKIEHIEPAHAHPRVVARGWSGTLARAAYAGSYGLSLSVALPAYAVASLFRHRDGAPSPGVSPQPPSTLAQPVSAAASSVAAGEESQPTPVLRAL